MFLCKQKMAYEMRISDWSSDVCSSDLADLLRVDHLEHRGAVVVVDLAQLGDHRGGDVKAARLQHQRHHGEARQQVVRRLLGRLPEAVVGRQVAVGEAESRQPLGQQQVVPAFLQNGRTTCWESVGSSVLNFVVAGSLKKNKNNY